MNILRFLFLAFFTTLLCSCNFFSNRKYDAVFRVGVRALPARIDPVNNEINIYHYINLHLFYPLFQKDESGILVSEYLDMAETKGLDETFSRFQFCLKSGLLFLDGSPVHIDELSRAIEVGHEKNAELATVKIISSDNPRCIRVDLSRTDSNYFEKLTTIQSAVLKKGSAKDESPVGIGPYRIKERRLDRIILTAADKNKLPFYREIQFIKVESPEQGKQEQLQDWNHIWQYMGKETLIPKEITAKYKKVIRPLFRSLVLVVNLNNAKTRQEFGRCFNRKGFLQNVGLQLLNIPGYLPVGLSGSKVDYDQIVQSWKLPESNCKSFGPKKTVRFYHFYSNLDAEIRKYFLDANPYLPVKVEVKLVSVEEAIRRVFNQEELMMPIMADATRPSSVGFFSFLMGQKKIVNSDISGLRSFVALGSQASADESKDAFFRKAHEAVLSSGYIIPLGQIEAVLYYPPEVIGIDVIDQINGFPLIHRLRVEQ
jgi:hypothetical protein